MEDIVQKALDALNQEQAVEEEGEQKAAWKDNTPFLYDFLIASDLEHTSHTVQWLPGSEP
jgi:hypothetical protein